MFLGIERQLVPQEVVVAAGQRCDSQVRDAVREVVAGVRGLAALELGVQGQRVEPRLRRVAERADRRSRVAEKKPCSLRVVAEHLSDAVWPAGEKRGREPWLERLHRRARLEPRDTARDRHAQHRRPGPLVCDLDRTDRLDVRADPSFGISEIHQIHVPRWIREPTGIEPQREQERPPS